jgi:hypothetical protein
MDLLLAFVVFGGGVVAGLTGKGLFDRAVARWKRVDFDTSTEG